MTLHACVIGGSGFLGSHVADALSDAGYTVRIFDQNASIWKKEDQEMIVGQLSDSAALSDAVKGCAVVYNFAALADLNEAMSKPIETVTTNILGNVKVLEACRINNIGRFLYASTVYVNSREGGFYRCSKHAAEQYVEEYSRAYDLDYTILRYGSLYGPRSGEENGLYRIVKGALDAGRLRYEGSSESLREYIHIEDAARASVSAIGKDFRNESVVLTGHEPLRVLDLLEMLNEILGIKVPVEIITTGQPGHYVRTPYAYKSQLGRKYIPPMHVDLGQGLLQMIEYVSEHNLTKMGETKN